MKKISLIASVVIVGGLLTGCGTSNSSNSNTQPKIEVNGIAVDDIIANGIIELHKGSINGPLLATVRTDENGSYTADINETGIIVSKVYCDINSSFIEDNGTKINCNITKNSPLLSANIINGNQNTLNISPISDFMVKIAGDGNLTEDSLKEAKIKTAYIFGIDPVNTNPLENNSYKTIINALHKVAKDNNKTVLDILNNIETDVNDGDLGDNNYTKALAQALRGKLKTPFVDNNGTVNLSASDINIPYDKIAAAKSIFQSLRDQIDSISNENKTGTIDKEIKRANDELQNITFNNIDIGVQLIPTLVDKILKNETNGIITVDNPKNEETFNYSYTKNNKTYHYSIKDSNNNEWNGTITFTGDMPPSDINESTSSFNTTLKLNIIGNLPQDFNSSNSQEINTEISLSLNKSQKLFNLNIDKIELKNTDTDVYVKNINVEMKVTGFSKNDQPEYIKLKSAEIYGKAKDFEINETLTIGDYVQNADLHDKFGDQISGYEYEIYDGRIICEDKNGNQADYNASEVEFKLLDDNNNTIIDKNISLYDGYISNFEFQTKYDLDNIGQKDAYDNIKNAFVLDQNACQTNYTPQIEWLNFHNEDDIVTNSGWLPNNITFTGTIKDINTSVELDGTISATATNLSTVKDGEVVTGTIHASVDLKRPDYKTITVNADYTSKTNEDDITLSYLNDNNIWITIDGKYYYKPNSKTKLISGVVNITSTDGLKTTLQINSDGDVENNATVYYDNTAIGTVQPDDDVNIIKYSDGTFESLN